MNSGKDLIHQTDKMASVSISGLRRNIKNVAHNYTDAQVKVREATSNDPWGPSSTQMSEIADLTYNMVAFSEIMQMIWKRLNDHGKNWRHVYKALVLLEYLIKTGSEKVAQQCKENIFAIQTLKDFQFVEENKDQGLNVREKAKAMVSLLKDDERLKNERVRALKAKERFAQSTAGPGIGSDTSGGGIGSDTAFGSGLNHREHQQDGGDHMASPTEDPLRPDIELARPQTHGEEELQLQLALAMSREEADAEETKKKSDDMRLTLAIQKSKQDSTGTDPPPATGGGSALNDLVDLNFGGPVQGPSPPQRTAASLDPWSPMGEAAGGDPWGGVTQSTLPDPWGGIGAHGVPPSRGSPLVFRQGSPPNDDPWGSGGESGNGAGATGLYPNLGGTSGGDPWGAPAATASVSPVPQGEVDPFSPASPAKATGSQDLLAGGWEGQPLNGSQGMGTSPQHMSQQAPANPWDLSGLDPMAGGVTHTNTGAKPKKIVESLLGEHSNLVNLDNLIQPKTTGTTVAAKNPFADQPNPFQAAVAPKPTMNQLMTGGQPAAPAMGSAWPDASKNQSNDINPFF